MEKNKQKSISLEDKVEEIYPLPKSWKWITTNDVCSKINDGTHFSPTNNAKGDIPYITAKNIRPDKIDLSNVTYIDKKTHQKIYARCNPEKDDVLYTKDGTVGYSAVNNLDFEFSLLSSVALLKPHKSIISSHYLSNYLNSPVNFYRTTGKMTGTALRRIILKTIKEIPIPLAPLNEQKRIVAKIEKILSVLKFIKKNIKVILNQLEQYQESFLIQKFQPWLEKEEFNLKLDDLTISRKIGLVRARNVQCKIGTPYLKMNNITLGGKLDLHNIVNVNVDSKELNNFILKKGDILFNTRNSYELVGKTSVWNDEIPNCVYNNNIMQIRVKNILEPKFLSYFMNTRNFKNNLLEIKRATTNICAIYDKDLKKQKIPVPPLNEQKKIIKEIKLNISLIENQKELMRSVLDKINIIQSSILKQAFEGKLVPQDPNDEPASELLKRIKLKTIIR